MKYYAHLSVQSLIRTLHQRDDEIEELKNNPKHNTYKALADELHEERNLRDSYQESTLLLHKELQRYKKLVGDTYEDPQILDVPR